MAKITKKQLAEFIEAFDSYIRLFNIEIEYWKERQISVMKKHKDYKTFNLESDFRDFGIQSFIHHMKKQYDEYSQMFDAVKFARDVGEGLYDKDDEDE